MQNPDVLIHQFQQHLKQSGLSSVSAKNYAADTRKYLSWCRLQNVDHTTLNSLDLYKSHLIKSVLPPSTIARTTSSLKKFASFLTSTDINLSPPAIAPGVNTQDPSSLHHQLLTDFEAFLTREQLSPATVKNYLSDNHQF